jgi:membrane protease YdiL (CAAX protease family)
VTLLTGLSVSAFLLWRNHARPHMPFYEFNALNTAFILFVPLVVLLLFLRRDPSEFGFTVGDSAKGNLVAVFLFALFVPVIMYAAPQAPSQRYYLSWMGESLAMQGAWYNGRIWQGGQVDWPHLAYHEVVMGLYMFGWEWYHRGFLLNGLRKILPTWGAVLVQALLFFALHWGKPAAEMWSSLPGGILMGAFAVRFRSFVPCFLLHWLISAGFDGAVLFYHFR